MIPIFFRSAGVLLLVCLFTGCKQPVQSQSDPGAPPERDLAEVNERVFEVRQTAITRAVDEVAQAVVSVNVIEVQRVRRPYQNPLFEFFYGRNPSRVYAREVHHVGSGFVISPDGYIVTNDHVAGDATKITISFSDGRTLPAQLIGTDPISDIALLKVDPDHSLPHATFSDAPPIPGEWAIALGNPFGLFEASEPSVTVGVVSAVGRNLEPQEGHVYRDMIQTDASINSGNSGGPLVNAVGEIIGVNTAIFSRVGGSIGIGFAVPAAKVQRIIRELRVNGEVDRTFYTGLYLSDVTPRIRQLLNLPSDAGVIVRDLDVGSPADQGGFEPYDIIIMAAGEEVEDQNDLLAILYDYRPGDSVRMKVLRSGEPLDLGLRLGELGG